MEKILVLLLYLYILFSNPVLCQTDNSASLKYGPFLNEKLDFSLSYKGLGSAKSTMIFQTSHNNSNNYTVLWNVATRGFYSFLFKIDNQYKTTMDASGRLLSVEKKIHQKNIEQNMNIHYDHGKLIAAVNDTLFYNIRPHSQNLLSLLYNLRTMKVEPGDSLEFILDVENEFWKMNGVVRQTENVKGDFSYLPVLMYTFEFSSFPDYKRRPWKTDLFTNRIAGPDSKLLIILSNDDQKLPLYLEFGGQGGSVQMRLERVRKQ